MRDYSSNSYQRKKAPVNRVKVKRKPLDLKKYLKPAGKVAMVLAVVLITAGVLFAGYRATQQVTLFKLKNVEVTSSKRLSRDEILAMAGIEPGKDLVRMNLKTMGEQISQNPWVESVRIHRYYPDGLSIAVVEREPLAVMNMGYFYYLDTKGNVFKVLNQGDRLDYPVVTGFTEEEITRDPQGSREALKATCDLLKVLSEKGAFILADVSEIHYDKGFGFTLFTASGALPVKIGSGDFEAKVDRFAKVYQTLMAQKATLQYIDLDYIDKIIVKKNS